VPGDQPSDLGENVNQAGSYSRLIRGNKLH
jgi:hypothetical protein